MNYPRCGLYVRTVNAGRAEVEYKSTQKEIVFSEHIIWYTHGVSDSRDTRKVEPPIVVSYLQIFDGPDVHHIPIGAFCGLALPPPLRSWGSTVTLQFTTDSVVGGRGFLVEWTAVQDSGPPPTITPGINYMLLYIPKKARIWSWCLQVKRKCRLASVLFASSWYK